MKKIFVLGFVLALLVSCGNKKETYSDNIQDTFFGVKFGASKGEVKAAFAKQGYRNVSKETRDLMCFSEDDRISFGGFFWECANARFHNGQLYSISFYNATEFKEMALEDFENVLPALSKKYNMIEQPIEDENTYKHYEAITKDGKKVVLNCFRGESFFGKMLYYTGIRYIDYKYKTNDEL